MQIVTIDLRMLGASGIGTYLANVIPGVIRAHPEVTFCLLGDIQKLASVSGLQASNVIAKHCVAPIYSIREQLEVYLKIPSTTSVLWCPHYNIPILYRGKLLVTIYDTFHLAMPHLVGGWHKTLYAKFMFAAVRYKADAILSISEFTKNEFLRLTGPQRCPVYAIPLGVDGSFFTCNSKASPHPRPFILCVGNVKPHKNLATLVRAFISISTLIPHDLVVVGKKEGFITGDSKTLIEASHFSERIKFTGYVGSEALRSYFCHASALVFPSFYEGFGLPPLEAMASGCPVIVSNAASLPEVCGDAAVYFDPYQVDDLATKITLLLKDRALQDLLRGKGLQRAEQLNWRNSIRKTSQVLSDLLLLRNTDHES